MLAPVIFSQATVNFQITVWSTEIENGKCSNPQQSPFTGTETQISPAPVLGERKDGKKIFFLWICIMYFLKCQTQVLFRNGKGKFCCKNACKMGWGLPNKIFIIKQLPLLYVVVVLLK